MLHIPKRVIVVVVLAVSLPFWLPLACPLVRLFATDEMRMLVALKNRTALPRPQDFDSRVTLEALLAPGPDRTRWSSDRAARVEGYVVAVHAAGVELANCFWLTRRDVHIDVALRPDAPPRARLVLEVTPPMRDWATTRGLDWSESALTQLTGRRVLFEGWLMFDSEHDDESENSNPGQPGNWRATAWEVHPVTHWAIQH